MAMKQKRTERVAPKLAPSKRKQNAERHLGATEEQVGDRTGSGAGSDLPDRSNKPARKGGVASS
jgi:hypothetical protein